MKRITCGLCSCGEQRDACCEYEEFYFAAHARLGRKFRTTEHGNRVRDEGVRRFAWAVPSRAALACIATHAAQSAQVVDFGAGSGYWAHCVERYCETPGAKVIALDERPELYAGCEWFSVQRGGVAELCEALDGGGSGGSSSAAAILLLLIWPTWGDPMAAIAARLFHERGGERHVYVGEDRDGATAAPDFFDEVECSGRWREVDTAAVHSWHGRHDRLRVFRRAVQHRSEVRGA